MNGRDTPVKYYGGEFGAPSPPVGGQNWRIWGKNAPRPARPARRHPLPRSHPSSPRTQSTLPLRATPALRPYFSARAPHPAQPPHGMPAAPHSNAPHPPPSPQPPPPAPAGGGGVHAPAPSPPTPLPPQRAGGEETPPWIRVSYSVFSPYFPRIFYKCQKKSVFLQRCFTNVITMAIYRKSMKTKPDPWWIILLKVLAYAIGLILAGYSTPLCLARFINFMGGLF